MKKGIYIVLLHTTIIVITALILIKFNRLAFQNFPKGLLNLDAYWYQSIAKSGYDYLENRTCNLAFFPLFPAFWKLSALNPVGISIANLFIFFATFIALVKFLDLTAKLCLLILGTSSFIFFALPYSESLFFFTGFLLIYGYDKENSWLKNCGFLMISLTRSVSIIFIPLIIFTELITGNRSLKSKIYTILKSCLITLAGMLIVAYIQFLQTGKLFYFLEVQKYWRRHFILPKLPLTTYMPDKIMFLDAIALVIGVLAIYFVVKLCVLKIKAPKEKIHLSKSLVFSLGYISVVTFIDVFFTFYDEKAGTNIWSINRHVMCTPFYIVFMSYLLRTTHHKNEFGLFFLIIYLVFVSAGLINYFPMSCFYVVFFSQLILLRLKRKYKNLFIPLYFVSVVLQVFLFEQFLNGGWVG